MLKAMIVLCSAALLSMLAYPAQALTVRDYLATCAKDKTACETAVLIADFAADPGRGQCGPDDSSKETKEVVAWLRAHPGLLDKDASAGIRAVLTALYSCKPL